MVKDGCSCGALVISTIGVGRQSILTTHISGDTTPMADEQLVIDQLNQIVKDSYPDEFRSGWVVIDYTHNEGYSEPHQIKVCKGRLISDDNCWTAASLSPKEALHTAMLMTQQ